MGTSVSLVWNKSSEAYLNNRDCDNYESNYEYVFKLSYHCLDKIDFDYDIFQGAEEDNQPLEILLEFAKWLERVYYIGKNLPDVLKELHWLLRDGEDDRYEEVMTDLELSAISCREAYYKGKRMAVHGLNPVVSVG